MSQDLFDAIANSQATQGGNFVRDGKYLFAVQNVIAKRGNEGRMFIVEFMVLSSEPVTIAHPKRQSEWGPSKPNAPGSTCSVVCKLDKHKSAGGNAKAFALALIGKKEGEVTPQQVAELLAKLCDNRQPARGMLIADTTYEGSIQSGPNAGNPITKHSWAHIPNQTKEDIAKRRATIDQAMAAAQQPPAPAAPAAAPQQPAPAWPAQPTAAAPVTQPQGAPQWAPQPAPGYAPPAPMAPVPQYPAQPAAGFAPPSPVGYAPPVQAQQPAAPAAPAAPSALDFGL